MKKQALAILILLSGSKIASACSVVADPDNPNFNPIEENGFYARIYFYSLVFLILSNIVLFFWRRQKDYLFLILIFAAVLVMIPLTFFGILMADCGETLKDILKWDFIIFAVISVIHVGLWLTKGSLRIKKTDITPIKLH